MFRGEWGVEESGSAMNILTFSICGPLDNDNSWRTWPSVLRRPVGRARFRSRCCWFRPSLGAGTRPRGWERMAPLLFRAMLRRTSWLLLTRLLISLTRYVSVSVNQTLDGRGCLSVCERVLILGACCCLLLSVFNSSAFVGTKKRRKIWK